MEQQHFGGKIRKSGSDKVEVLLLFARNESALILPGPADGGLSLCEFCLDFHVPPSLPEGS